MTHPLEDIRRLEAENASLRADLENAHAEWSEVFAELVTFAASNGFTVLFQCNNFHPDHTRQFPNCVNGSKITLVPMDRTVHRWNIEFQADTAGRVTAQLAAFLTAGTTSPDAKRPEKKRRTGWTPEARAAAAERMRERQARKYGRMPKPAFPVAEVMADLKREWEETEGAALTHEGAAA